jgi:hypothetical protein
MRVKSGDIAYQGRALGRTITCDYKNNRDKEKKHLFQESVFIKHIALHGLNKSLRKPYVD